MLLTGIESEYIMTGLLMYIILSGVLVAMPVLEVHGETKKSPRPTPEAEPATRSARTSKEQALFTKGKLLHDRWCSLDVQLKIKELAAFEEKLADATKYYGLTHPETYRRDAERQRGLDPLRHDVQNAKRDLDLFEIDV